MCCAMFVIEGHEGEENLLKTCCSGQILAIKCGLQLSEWTVIDDGREVLLDDEAKKSPPSLWPQKFKEVRTYKINSISVIFTFLNSVSSIPISTCAS